MNYTVDMRKSKLLLSLLACLLAAFLAAPMEAQTKTDTTKKAAKSAPAPAAAKAGALLDLNSASLADLKALPGIGDVYSKKIVDGRPVPAQGSTGFEEHRSPGDLRQDQRLGDRQTGPPPRSDGQRNC